ncbi:hypothetical protein Tco_0117208 [Tanacetum coccineum]
MNLIDCTLQRYLRDNIPIQSFDLNIIIADTMSTFLVGKWIRSIAIKSCLKELNLTIFCYSNYSYAFPDEIFSGENLDTVRVKACPKTSHQMSSNLVIKCLSLRVLELQGLRTIKVENLCRLRVMKTKLMRNQNMEIVGVPNACCVIPNKDFSNMINSKFPFLETLTLCDIRFNPQNLDIRCLTVKRLSLQFRENMQCNVQVYAPRLVLLCYEGYTIPNLLFPTITPEQIKLSLRLDAPIELTLFLKMRGILNISSKFDIEILLTPSNSLVSLNTSITELRKCVPIPAPNVQQLSILTSSDHILWENSP